MHKAAPLLATTLICFATTSAVFAQSLTAPDTANVGAEISVGVSGSKNPRDFVTIVAKQAREGAYVDYKYANQPTITLRVPVSLGDYEIRLLGAASPYPTLARRALKVENVVATLDAPARVAGGEVFAVTWTGPNNARDYVGIGNRDAKYLSYVYTRDGSPIALTAPDEAGEYELRYFLGNGDAVIASKRITVTRISATIQGPSTVVAGAAFDVSWQGPNNAQDYITIVAKGAREGVSGNYGYTAKGNPTKVLAPLTAGDYELRYASGQSHSTLASTAIRITPGKEEPGFVQATLLDATPADRAVEIIVDASGSMLQRIGSQRRIDIAKQTLTKLTSSVLPAGTAFALRVFGREIDSCQTDLEIPLAPLNAATVGARISALEAKNNAKTPIGASLDNAAADLSTAKGERWIIVLTDGEETCGGDPAASIEKLRRGSRAIRVSIVGFAIDDEKLAASFRQWSDLGAGMYFDAKDAAGLSSALARALQPSFELVGAQGLIVAEGLVGGEPIKVAPGNYTVRLKGQADRAQSIVVKSKETAQTQL